MPATPRENASVPRSQWIAAALVLLIIYPLFFFDLGAWGLFDPDEGRYAEVAREMLARHDWVTPTLDYVKFFDKPPLLYWGIAASYSVFGVNEWPARLVPALAALLGLIMTWILGRRMFGARAAILAVLILATSLMWPLMARVVLTDMLFSALVFTSLALWWTGHTSQGRAQTGAFIGFWIALALGVLAKGPVAVVLVGGTLFFYLTLCGQWRSVARMKWGAGVPLFLAMAAPWFVLVAARNPEFNHIFWFEQHVGRFLGDRAIRDHVNGPFYLLELLPLLCFPWSIFWPLALVAAWKKLWPARSLHQRALVFLGCGCVWTTLFFSVSDSKIVTYVLPVLPLLALGMGAYLERVLVAARFERPSLSLRWSTIVLALLLGIGGVVGLALGPPNLRAIGVSETGALAVGLLLLFWAAALALAAHRGGARHIIGVVAGGFVLTFSGGVMLVNAVAPALTSRPVLEAIRPGLAPDTKIATFSYVHSASFYARRRVLVEGAPHELIDGLKPLPPVEKRRWFFDGTVQLRAILAGPEPVYAVLQMSRAERRQTLRELGATVSEIAANEKFAVVGNRAALRVTPPVHSGPFRVAAPALLEAR